MMVTNNSYCKKTIAILFAKLPLPGYLHQRSILIIESSCHLPNAHLATHIYCTFHSVLFYCQMSSEEIVISRLPVFILFGLTWSTIEAESTVSVKEGWFTRRLMIVVIKFRIYLVVGKSIMRFLSKNSCHLSNIICLMPLQKCVCTLNFSGFYNWSTKRLCVKFSIYLVVCIDVNWLWSRINYTLGKFRQMVGKIAITVK